MPAPPATRPPAGAPQDDLQTIQVREFAGVNRTDQRSAIQDKEFFWLENVLRVGNGDLTLVPAQAGPITSITGTTIATLWGFLLTLGGVATPLFVTVNADGSLTQVKTDGSKTTMGGPGTVTPKARLAPWQDTNVLIVDPTKGYLQWDGTTLTTIDATKKATDIAVFEGRAWLVTATRTITFTAPGTFSDFTLANGAGSVTIRDAVFEGSIVRLLSALEQLWIVGPAAVDAISNVQTAGTPAITTFSITNIVANVGTTHPSSVTSFFRTFLFLTHYGVYAIVGSTPQKLSDKLDGLWPEIAFTAGDDIPAGLCTINDIFVWAALVRVRDPFGADVRPLVLCFAGGHWFFVNEDTRLTWLTTLLSADGDPQLWGTDGTTIYQLFGDLTRTIAVPYRITTKLFDFGSGTQMKHLTRVGFDFNSENLVTATLTLENEFRAQQQTAVVQATNTISFTGAGGLPLTFVGTGALTWISGGLQIVRRSVNMLGRYLGLTLTGTSAPFTVSMMAMQVKPAGDWN